MIKIDMYDKENIKSKHYEFFKKEIFTSEAYLDIKKEITRTDDVIEFLKNLQGEYADMKTHEEKLGYLLAVGELEDLKKLQSCINRNLNDFIKSKFEVKKSNIIEDIEQAISEIEEQNDKKSEKIFEKLKERGSKRKTIRKALEENNDKFFNEKCKNILLEYLNNDSTFYTIFTGSRSGWNRKLFLDALDIKTCPYCNISIINNTYEKTIISYDKVNYKHIYKSEELDLGMSIADIDHFFSKSNYPLFSASLYNLVPSCKNCNSTFKTTKDFLKNEHVYPYNENFDALGVFFKIVFKNVDDNQLNELLSKIMSGNFSEDDFYVYLDLLSTKDKDKSKIENAIETFKLNERYNSSRTNLLDFLKRYATVNDATIKSALNTMNIGELDIDFNMNIFGDIIDNVAYSKYPFGKLHKDIYNQLENENLF